ncbi:MAG: hypothetical protein WB699_06870 [Bacteroidota bacterium]
MTKAVILVSIVLQLLCNTSAAQPARSQRELNGFLLGQTHSAITSSFDKLLQKQTSDDGWTEYAYSIDTSFAAYMAFGFADSGGKCLSIQITGKPGTRMRPFLGLVLGDSKEKVLHKLGGEAGTVHEPDLNLDHLTYAKRNYSVELDSLGRLFSIRLVGYEGIPEHPSSPVDDLGSVAQTLRSRNVDAILDLLAPDVEVSTGDSIVTFEGGARAELSNSTSPISRFLYEADSSILLLLAEPTSEKAELKLRLYEDRTSGYVYTFPSESKLKEIVFIPDTGKWRIWEIRLSR